MVKVIVNPAPWVESGTMMVKAKASPDRANNSTDLGLRVHVLTRELANRYGAKMTQGVLVIGIEEGMPAALKGLKVGDVITRVDNQPVTDPKQFREALTNIDLKEGVPVNFMRGETARFEILKESGD